MENERRIVETDTATFNEYLKAGLWKTTEAVKFHKQYAGICNGEVQTKPRRNDPAHFIPVPFIIRGYFFYPELISQRERREA